MKDIYEWRDSPIFPQRYEVSSFGEVRNKETKRILKPTYDKYGYLYCVLCVSGERRTVKIHRLVAKAFINNPQNKPAIDHINGNRHDNRIGNLRWVTNKENTNNPITLSKVRAACLTQIPIMKQKSMERGYGRKRTYVYRDNQLVGVFKSQKEAAKIVGISEGKVSTHIKNRKPTRKGFILKSKEDSDAN